jgi:hypothetical protein
MRLFWYLVDVFAAITFMIAGLVVESKLWLILFIPCIAFLIPVMIYLSEKQRRGEKVDYSY